MFGNLDTPTIEDVLAQQFIGRIGCHTNDFIYVVPISYAYDGKNIYGYSEEGLKLDVMRKNPTVCFEVDTMVNMANWKSVIAWGKFEELNSNEERHNALHLLMDRKLPIVVSKKAKITEEWPFYPTDINDVTGVLFRIKLTKKTGRFESMN